MSIVLKGINFGSVFLSSGVVNFFGQGWRHHDLYKFIPGFCFEGATEVMKTTTVFPRLGNMFLDENLQPKELFPKCIYVDFLKGIALNAVSLSGPGIAVLLSNGKWQKKTTPFVISVMSVADTKTKRLLEMEHIVELLKMFIPKFHAPVAIEINVSCPNTKHNPKELAEEGIDLLKIASSLNAPLILKVNALVWIETIRAIQNSGYCDAISCSNTIPWGEMSDKIDWEKLFGTKLSPLAHLGGGGLSGKPLLPIVCDWIQYARSAGITLPIIAGGGILDPADLKKLHFSGANGIGLGSITILRPWRVKSTIKEGKRLFS